MSSRGARNDQLGPRVHRAHLRHRPDRQVETLLWIVPVGQQDIRPADGIPVDGEATTEAGVGRKRKPRRGDVTSRRTVDGLTAVDAADDVADVAAIDQQLVRLLHRPAVGPRHEPGCPEHDLGEQPVVRVRDPAGLTVDVAGIDEPVRLVQVDNVRDVDESCRPPCDPCAGLVASDDRVDTAEAPRVERHEQRRRRHLDGLTKWEPARQLRKECAHINFAQQVRVAARSVHGRRVALDLEAPAP